MPPLIYPRFSVKNTACLLSYIRLSLRNAHFSPLNYPRFTPPNKVILCHLNYLTFSARNFTSVPPNLPQLFPQRSSFRPLQITSVFTPKMSPLSYFNFPSIKLTLCPLNYLSFSLKFHRSTLLPSEAAAQPPSERSVTAQSLPRGDSKTHYQTPQSAPRPQARVPARVAAVPLDERRSRSAAAVSNPAPPAADERTAAGKRRAPPRR